jgi:hypothetical protein
MAMHQALPASPCACCAAQRGSASQMAVAGAWLKPCLALFVLQPKPKPCNLGYYYNFTTESCTICPAGTWESNTYSTACNPCRPGTFSGAKGEGHEARCCALAANGTCI